MQPLDDYLSTHQSDFERDLFQWLRIASVSADPEHATDMREAASWALAQLSGPGLSSELIETDGHPMVYAETAHIPGKPTVLVYGHYDVQPPDPLDEWISPPFEPTVRDGNVFARGATDDKGQLLTHIKSVQAWLQATGSLPLQVKFLIEGEEEVGSLGLEAFVKQNTTRLQCDVVVISDTSQFGPGQPAITYGLKGIAYFELHLQGPRQDLHSGTFGGAVSNPANALTKLLASLIDDDGRIQISGFYDDVVPLTESERAQFVSLPFDERKFREQIGVHDVHGEAGFSTLERRWARPTFDINGLASGYQGTGAKTVLPARSSAKFSFRLVPHQDPTKIRQQLESHLERHCPAGITFKLVDMHGAPGFVIPLDSPFVEAAAAGIERGFGRRPCFIREGGSIPIVTTFREFLGVDTLLLGWGQDDDNMHSPNEKFSVQDFHRGVKSSAYLWDELSRIEP